MTEIACDIETTGLNWKKDKILYIGTYPETSMLGYTQGDFIWHNGKFDLKFLKEAKIDSFSLKHDTYLLASLVPHESRSLLALVQTYQLGTSEERQFLDKMKENRTNMSAMSQADLEAYCSLDCKLTLKLYNVLMEKLNNSRELAFYSNYLLPAYRMIVDVEMEGIDLNMSLLDDLTTSTQKRTVMIQKQMRESVRDLIELEEKLWLSDSLRALKEPRNREGKAYDKYLLRINRRKISPKQFNWKSSQQVLWLIRDALGIPCKNYENKDSIAESVLNGIKDKHPVINCILEYRKLTKLKTAFLDRWKQDAVKGKIYTNFDITGTRTGRLSSSNPNLQQVPKNAEIRKLFIAPPGYSFIINDYSQIEPRVAAHYSGEDILKWVFDQGLDLYEQISLDIFGNYDSSMRKLAKTVTLAMFYGAGAGKLKWIIKNQLNKDMAYSECEDIVERFNRSYPKIKKFKEKLKITLEERKGKIYNLYGRPLFINKDQERSAFNTLIQSTASDICLFRNRVMSDCMSSLNIPAKLVLLVHDEAVYKVENTFINKVKNLLALNLVDVSDQEFSVPLKINQRVAQTWAG